MDYENCIYFKARDTTSWHVDIFNCPDHIYSCTKDDKKEIWWPAKVCNKYKSYRTE